MTFAAMAATLISGPDVSANELDPSQLAFQRLAERARTIANGDRENWEKVAYILNQELATPFAFLPNVAVLEVYAGRITRNPVPNVGSREDKAKIALLLGQWRTYVEIIRRHNKEGRITFDIYPCTDTCEGHKSGFEWAERDQITDYGGCQGASRSFVEGCYVQVTRKKGLVLPSASYINTKD